MQDWLGNELEVGGLVLYSSSSTNTGMNLGELTYVGPDKIQIRIWSATPGMYSISYSIGKLVTLKPKNGAYKSVTRYFGKVPTLKDQS